MNNNKLVKNKNHTNIRVSRCAAVYFFLNVCIQKLAEKNYILAIAKNDHVKRDDAMNERRRQRMKIVLVVSRHSGRI